MLRREINKIHYGHFKTKIGTIFVEWKKYSHRKKYLEKGELI